MEPNYKELFIEAVETLEFLVASSNCIEDAARNRNRGREEVWETFSRLRDGMLIAKLSRQGR